MKNSLRARLKSPHSRAETSGVNPYSRPPVRHEDILKILTRTPSGRSLLERFMPLLHQKKVRLEPYPAELVARLRSALPEGQPIGAALIQDGNTGTIHFDGSAPVGILACFLVHEISHALDPAVWKGDAHLSREKGAMAELKAFEDQFRFTEELKARDEAFALFLKETLPQARILHERMTLESIDELYFPLLRTG